MTAPKPKTLYRELELKPEAVDLEKRTVRLSFSSDAAYKREFGYEVLSHAPGAMDTSRLDKRSLSLLDNHNRDRQVGVIQDYEIIGGKGYATAKLSRSKLGEEMLQDISDGIRTNTSVGYTISKMEKTGKHEDGSDEYTVTKWVPLEISIVSVPADETVGVGRSKKEDDQIELYDEDGNRIDADGNLLEDEESDDDEPLEDDEDEGEKALSGVTSRGLVVIEEPTQFMPEATETKETSVTITKESMDKVRADEQIRFREISTIGKNFGAEKEADDFIRSGKSVEQFKVYMLDVKLASGGTRIVTVGEEDFLTPKQKNRYSLSKAILEGHEHISGFEKEVSAEVAKRTGRSPQGFYLPDFALTRDLSAGVGTAGGTFIQTTVEPTLIELLRNRVIVARAGATMMGGLKGPVSIPRQTGSASATWLAENAQITRTAQTFDQISLSPKRLGAVTAFSKQLLIESSLDVDSIVQNDILKIVAIAQDAAALYGTGSGSNQPLGLYNYTENAPGSFAAGLRSPGVTFSGAPTYSKIVAFEGNVEDSNVVLNDSAGYITSPKVKAAWKTTTKAVNYPVYLWEGSEDGTVNGYNSFASHQITGNTVVFGKWDEAIIATWAGIDILTDPYSLADSYLIRVIVNLLTDVSYRHPISFSISTDAGNQ